MSRIDRGRLGRALRHRIAKVSRTSTHNDNDGRALPRGSLAAWFCDCFIYVAAAVRGGKRQYLVGFYSAESPQNPTDLCGIDLQYLAVGRPQPIAKPRVDFRPVTDKGAESVIQAHFD
jgi:hypothetical protein